jgi:hypothetical protein
MAADRLVHRWADANGLVHYGDANAAATHRNAKTVAVLQPMSVVHNDRPITNPPDAHKPPHRRSAHPSPQHQVSPPATDCNRQRDRLSDSHTSTSTFRNLQQQYDDQCIKGHYYGNSTL